MKTPLALGLALFAFSRLYASAENGESVFKMYCASCHGPEGAGLIGPNLTDPEVLHGSAHEQIVNVIENGVPNRAMPAWSSILQPEQIDDVALFVKSIMGKNLPSPVLTGNSAVTSFPKGSLNRPLLMRTFMPVLDLQNDVFKNHYISRGTPKYKAKTGLFDPEKIDEPIEGIPGAITVNFGDQLSYCFDSTECRLLYTWNGGFMDMTQYWGEGTGGQRKKFGYIGELIGEPSYIARGGPPLDGAPRFKGYRKVNSVPEFMYSIGNVAFTLRIEPGENPGDAICHYTSENWTSQRTLRFPPENAAQISSDTGTLRNGVLSLNAREAKAFTLTIKANP